MTGRRVAFGNIFTSAAEQLFAVEYVPIAAFELLPSAQLAPDESFIANAKRHVPGESWGALRKIC